MKLDNPLELTLEDIERCMDIPDLQKTKKKNKSKNRYRPPSIDHKILQLHAQKWLYRYGCRYGEDEIVGVEVKVSKSDLVKGFCLAGCHRNFILVPKELLDALKDIPSWVGILYFDGKIVKCKRGAKYRKTRAKSEYLKQEILERNSSQIRFLFLDIVLEAMSNE